MKSHFNQTISLFIVLTFMLLLNCCGNGSSFNRVLSTKRTSNQQNSENAQTKSADNNNHDTGIAIASPGNYDDDDWDNNNNFEEGWEVSQWNNNNYNDERDNEDSGYEDWFNNNLNNYNEHDGFTESKYLQTPRCLIRGINSGWYHNDTLLHYDDCNNPRTIICVKEASKSYPTPGYYIDNGTPFGLLLLKGICF